jgi:hypothetical protein
MTEDTTAEQAQDAAARIVAAEAGSEGRDFDRRSWQWMLLLGVLLPAALIIAGWFFA